ncbi:hypothetical protein [Argonema antarcticum]|uniref:hypothetical protein n=1 Tax=Argonema antarcticum TaxID=2942763 RepID=UPI002012A100|nr:hypothetical protein [Argonema antarcticum]MCL1473780.1 hypothetical protein [Argonema antarcticum A004/B2]
MGQLNIPAASIVYVDTAIVIYSIEKFPDYFPLLEPMWKQLQSSQIHVSAGGGESAFAKRAP